MKNRETLPDMYVLDSLANDVEDLEGILRILNSDTAIGWHRRWGRYFTRAEIVQSLVRLIASDRVRVSVLTPDGKWLEELPAKDLPGAFSEAWFALTPRGRMVHTAWEPGDLNNESELGQGSVD